MANFKFAIGKFVSFLAQLQRLLLYSCKLQASVGKMTAALSG